MLLLSPTDRVLLASRPNLLEAWRSPGRARTVPEPCQFRDIGCYTAALMLLRAICRMMRLGADHSRVCAVSDIFTARGRERPTKRRRMAVSRPLQRRHNAHGV